MTSTIIPAILLCCTSIATAAELPDYVNAPAFSATPKRLLEAFNEIPQTNPAKSTSMDILLDKTDYEFQQNLRLRSVRRQIYRVLNRNAIESHSTLEAAWSPWFQNEPIIKARVISPDGKIRQLDQSAIERSNLPSRDPRIFTDMKLLRTPLPALNVGAIVEYEIVTDEFKSPLNSAVTLDHILGNFFEPTRQTILRISHPDSLKLTHRRFDFKQAPQTETANGKTTLTFESRRTPALADNLETFLPTDVSPWPKLSFSVGGSWNDVAREYHQIVEAQIQGQDLSNLISETVSSSDSQEAKISKLLVLVHKLARYTGIAFGESAFVPERPIRTVQRGYGDCKDKSVLLVSLLRSAGIPANVALLNIGASMDVVPNLPGLNAFDHAIVYVPGNTPLWIDPTSEYAPVGRLPIVDQDRWALVIDESSKHLTKTPRRSSKENSVSYDISIQLNTNGKNTISVSTEFKGEFAQQARSVFATLQEEQLKQFLLTRGAQMFAAKKLASYQAKRLKEIGKPFQLIAHYEESDLMALRGAYGECVLNPSFLLSNLPETLRVIPESDDAVQSVRRHPMKLPRPHTKSATYRISAPFGYSISETPKEQSRNFAGLHVTEKHTRLKPNEIEAKFELRTGDEVLSAKQVEEMRAGIQSLADATSKSWLRSFLFEQQAGKYLATKIPARI